MQPGDNQGDGLQHAEPGHVVPDAEQHIGVAVVDADKSARRDHMLGQQRRQQEAEDVLDGFPGRHAQATADIEAPQRERDMRDDRAVQHGQADGIAPDRQEPEPAGLECLQIDQAERVIDEMRDDIGEQDQPAVQSDGFEDGWHADDR